MRIARSCTATLAAAAFTASSTFAADITGAGATFPYPIYAKWADAYKKSTGTGMNYQSIGSGGGIKQITAKTVDFGASDMPLKPEDLQKEGLIQFPAIMGGVVPVVNLEGITPGQLKFTGALLADIYLGKVTKWNDPAIAKLNAGVKLPDENITVVHRSDGSGTTFLWTNYLSKVSPEWKSTVGEGTAVNWPTGVGGKGNEGVASYVQKINGAVGYVEYAYAKQNKLSHGQMQNKSGKFVQAGGRRLQGRRSQRRLEQGSRLLSHPHRPGRQECVAHQRRHVHPHAQEAGQAREREGSPQVLRLGLRTGRRPARLEPRLRAAARQCGEAGRGVLEEHQGFFRQGRVLTVPKPP